MDELEDELGVQFEVLRTIRRRTVSGEIQWKGQSSINSAASSFASRPAVTRFTADFKKHTYVLESKDIFGREPFELKVHDRGRLSSKPRLVLSSALTTNLAQQYDYGMNEELRQLYEDVSTRAETPTRIAQQILDELRGP